MSIRLPFVAITFAWLCGCAAETDASPTSDVEEAAPLATGEEQRDRLCGRGRSDLLLDVLCEDEPASIDGILTLRSVLAIEDNRYESAQGFALTGHSTALAFRSVSAINPRILFVRPEGQGSDLVVLTFTRGEQFAEVVVRDRVMNELQFYLLTFQLACDDAPDGCLPGDLFTETIESGWRDVNVYAEEDLRNTPFDCRSCHQPNGPGTPKILRMQEFEPPWNHWFFRLVTGGQALIADYLAAKGDEAFAGVSATDVIDANPGALSAVIRVANMPQPNEYVSAVIEHEVRASAALEGGNQPHDNTIAGESRTWNALYERAKRGEAIQVPYYNVKITDPDKLATRTQAYADYRAGLLDRSALPDLRDIHPDDPMRRAQIGLDTEPGLDGEGVLVQACGQCHNDRLDQTLSRARFNVDLSKVDREVKERAIARVSLAPDEAGAMPPPRMRRLTDEAREKLIELLRR